MVRDFGRQADEEQDYREGSETLLHMQTFVGKISAVMNPVTYIIVNAAIIAIIWIGGIQVNIGNLTQGEVIALVNYMSQILVELVKLANLIILLTKAFACSKRVGEIFAMKPSVVESNQAKESMKTNNQKSDCKVLFQNVTFTYEGRNRRYAICHLQ